MYLSGGKRHAKDYAHYVCRRLECTEHAYARAEQLDAFVLNRIEELLTGRDYDGVLVGEPADKEIPRPNQDRTDDATSRTPLQRRV
jgi:hypothetical protein